MFRPFKKQPLIGLDFSADDIRLVQLRQAADGITVEKRLHRQQSLKDLVAEQGLKDAQVAFALPSQLLLRKQIELPACFKERELAVEIERRLLEYFSGVSEKLHFDYVVQRSEDDCHQVLLVAVREKDLQYYLKQVKDSGLKAQLVDSQLYALARAFIFQQKQELEQGAALLDLQASLSNFLVIHEDEIQFHYSWSLERGEPFLQQVKNGFQLYLATHPKRELHQLCLAGSVQGLDTLMKTIEEQLLFPVKLINPFQGMKFSPALKAEENAEHSSAFLVACGLALRGLRA